MNEQSSKRVRIRDQYLTGKNLSGVIMLCLPEQGAIEVQKDRPWKEHDWHEYQTDETLIVISGSFEFEWREGKAVCSEGDLIELPSGVRHRSKALQAGASYIIAMRMITQFR